MASTPDRVLEHVVVRQARRRAFNERLSRLDEGEGGEEARLFRCECGLIGCAATIRLSAEDYAVVRTAPRRFAVHVDHVIPEAEQVIARHGAHAIIEKPADAPVPPASANTRVTGLVRPDGLTAAKKAPKPAP